MIDGKFFFDQLLKNDSTTHDIIQKFATGQGDDYSTGCLLDYPYFKEYYKLIAIVRSKQQKLDVDPKAIQQNYFCGNLDWAGNMQMFFIIEKTKETVLDFSKGTVKVLWFYFVLI